MIRRRRPPRYSELTSLLDVLFILLFASLIQAAGVVSAAKPDPKKDPAIETAASAPEATPTTEASAESSVSVDHEDLRQRALGEIARSMSQREAVYAQISAEGLLVALEREVGGESQSLEIGAPLLLAVPDPEINLEYIGARDANLRLCTRVRVTLGLHDLNDHLIVVALAAPIPELRVALVEGLRADIQRCFTDERGVAVLVPPERAP